MVLNLFISLSFICSSIVYTPSPTVAPYLPACTGAFILGWKTMGCCKLLFCVKGESVTGDFVLFIE